MATDASGEERWAPQSRERGSHRPARECWSLPEGKIAVCTLIGMVASIRACADDAIAWIRRPGRWTGSWRCRGLGSGLAYPTRKRRWVRTSVMASVATVPAERTSQCLGCMAIRSA